jgi:hypothetical protein
MHDNTHKMTVYVSFDSPPPHTKPSTPSDKNSKKIKVYSKVLKTSRGFYSNPTVEYL